MPLEATIVVLDNSAWALNGDYGTTRWDVGGDGMAATATATMTTTVDG